MYKIKATLVGLAPLLFNQPDLSEIDPPPDGPRPKPPSKLTLAERQERAEKKLYRDDGGVYLPGAMLKACILIGAARSGLKVGPRTSIATFLAAEIFPERKMYFDGKEDFDFMHECWGRIPPKRGAVVTIRRPALSEGWKLPIMLNVVADNRTSGEIRQCLDTAGMAAGLGSWRPEYGRFIVAAWEVDNGEKAAKGKSK